MSAERECIIERLSEKFAQSPYEIYLSGSVVRDEAPFGDIDITAIGGLDDDAPQEIVSKKVNYGIEDPAGFDVLLQDVPRYSHYFFDSMQISAEGKATVERERERFSPKLADCAFYLASEHLFSTKRVDLGRTNYFALKRVPGSRRSVMRTLFCLKSRFPAAMDRVTTNDALRYFVSTGELPEEYIEHVTRMFGMLAIVQSGGMLPSSKEWAGVTDTIEDVSSAVIKDTATWAEAALPQNYVALMHNIDETGLSEHDTDSNITSVLALNPYRQWNARYNLAINPNTDSNTLEELAATTPFTRPYRAIWRCFARNPTFMNFALIPSAMKTDRLVDKALQERQVSSSS